MDKFRDLSLWIEVGAIVVIGAVLLLAASRVVQLLANRVHLAPLTVRPIRFVLRWAGILVIVGLLANKLFDVDLMGLIFGGLALVAIGVVAIWSLLSHMTATMLLILLEPFRINDRIGFPGEEVAGRVVDLNLFYTLLDNEETGEHFIVPNNHFFQKAIRHIPSKGGEKIELHHQLGEPDPTKPAPEQ